MTAASGILTGDSGQAGKSVTFNQNGRSRSVGTTGHVQSESAVKFPRNTHAAGSIAFQALRLLQLHDLAQLSSRMTEADWDEVLAHRRRGTSLWWAFPPVNLTSRYFSSLIPSRVLTALADDYSFVLQAISRRKTLYDVSYSYPSVNAFPGVEWAQSLREVLEYGKNRVWPSAKHVAWREYSAKSQAWASHSPWIHLSQGRRIVRWLTSPPRAATLYAVSTALGQAR